MRTIFVFGFMIMGKELLADLNLAIFKIWLDTRPKMEMHDPNVYPTILGGVSQGFWGLLEALGARSAIFWHLKTGTFAKSARLQVPKNGPEPRTDPKNPAKHPPKWWGRHLDHAFPFSGEYQAKF